MKYLILPMLLLWSIVGIAAPTYDSSGSAGAGCSADSTPSVSVTVSAGSDRYGVGFIYWEGAVTVSSVSFGGQTPTLHKAHTGASFNMYRLDDPNTGAQTFAFTMSGAPSRCYVGWLTYSGAASLGTGVEATVNATTVSVDVSSGTGNLVVDAAVFGATTIDVGAGQTARVDADNFESTGRSYGSSDEAGASTVTMSWTTAVASDGFILAANLVAAGAGNTGIIMKRRRH